MTDGNYIAKTYPDIKRLKLANNKVLRWSKLSEHAFAPVRGSDKAVGLDF